MTNPNAPQTPKEPAFRDDKPYFDAMFTAWCEDAKVLSMYEFQEQPFVAYRLAHQRQQQEIEKRESLLAQREATIKRAVGYVNEIAAHGSIDDSAAQEILRRLQ